MSAPINERQSDSVTMLAIISALTAAVMAKLWHIEYFLAFSVAFVLVFTGFAFRDERTRKDRAKDLAGIWLSGIIVYAAARWLWR